MDKPLKVYFPGLNGLRFFAALAVIITHIELMKMLLDFHKSYWENPVIFNLGGLGVYFFFVLSGFLITYLLLKEKQETNNISIRDFYIRRVLRIWPLFYLIVFIGFVILPQFKSIHIPYLQADFFKHYYANLIMYLFIMPNLALSIFYAVPHIGQSWSIGVEEQFYLFWPWLIKKSKNIFNTLIGFIIIIVLVKIIILFLPLSMKQLPWYEPLKRFFAMSKLESMAIGGLGAYVLFFNKTNYLKWIYSRYLLWFSLCFIPVLIYFTPDILQDGNHIIYSLLFLIIIMNVANNKTYFKFENKLFNFLGNISYGIYMYHLIIIPIILVLFKKYNFINDDIIGNTILYITVVLLSVLVASISYYGYERIFIQFKKKFAKVDSGN